MAQEHVDRRTEAARARAARKAELADASRQVRAAAGWTQADAAQRLLISRDVIARLESGRMEYSAAAECVAALRAMGPTANETETRKEQEQ